MDGSNRLQFHEKKYHFCLHYFDRFQFHEKYKSCHFCLHNFILTDFNFTRKIVTYVYYIISTNFNFMHCNKKVKMKLSNRCIVQSLTAKYTPLLDDRCQYNRPSNDTDICQKSQKFIFVLVDILYFFTKNHFSLYI